MKAILVIEMPSSCKECNLQQFYICKPVGKSVVGTPTDLKSKPDWCPLKELPDKITSWKGKSTNYQQGHRDGYNTCIDEILGDKE